MATSGWQNEQTWFTYSSNVRLIGNIRIDSITHSGSNLRIQGAIAGGARGTNNYYFHYNDYTSYAQPEGGSKLALGGKGKQWKVGAADTVVGFDVTLTGVSSGTTSRSFFVNFYGPNTNSVKATLRWTLYFDASGSAPSGLYINNIVPTWDTITATIGATNWGGISPGVLQLKVLAQEYVAGVAARQNSYTNNSGPVTTTITNYSETFNGPNWTIKGCGYYYTGLYTDNTAGATRYQGPTTYTPPAPGSLTYTDPGGEGTKVYPVVFTGVAENNNTSYDTANLTRTVRYKIDNAADWTYVANDAQAAITDNTTFNLSLPGSKSAVVEAWMTYHNLQSEVKSVTIFNGNAPSRVYGSVDGSSKLLYKLYGSVDGHSKEIVKLYGSVDGKAKSILG
jgi:hypothetical protein